ncbi:MAG: hypothetical protein LBU73_01660 [Helicobacteraceae bacterium]|jgi:hypothetical protein|nr:hypothetical protein [Helicobacteraceae bacterium]
MSNFVILCSIFVLIGIYAVIGMEYNKRREAKEDGAGLAGARGRIGIFAIRRQSRSRALQFRIPQFLLFLAPRGFKSGGDRLVFFRVRNDVDLPLPLFFRGFIGVLIAFFRAFHLFPFFVGGDNPARLRRNVI